MPPSAGAVYPDLSSTPTTSGGWLRVWLSWLVVVLRLALVLVCVRCLRVCTLISVLSCLESAFEVRVFLFLSWFVRVCVLSWVEICDFWLLTPQRTAQRARLILQGPL